MPASNRKLMDLTGQVFGRLTVLREGTRKWMNNRWKRQWHCICKCGNRTFNLQSDLTNGNTKSCGCLLIEKRGKGSVTHGMSDIPEHCAWMQATQRAENKNLPYAFRYNGRGVKICNGYKASFQVFYEDIGPRPSPVHSLDRRDNNGHYSCGKCTQCLTSNWSMNIRWATPEEQANNRRGNRLLTFNNETLTLSNWAKRVGKKRSTIAARIKSGWSIEQALTVPLRLRISQIR